MTLKRLTKLQKSTLSAMLKRERYADATLEEDNARAIGGLSEHEKLIRRCTMSGASDCGYWNERAQRWTGSSTRTFLALCRLGLIEYKGSGWYLLSAEGRARAELED